MTPYEDTTRVDAKVEQRRRWLRECLRKYAPGLKLKGEDHERVADRGDAWEEDDEA